jgi:hypothetical protein
MGSLSGDAQTDPALWENQLQKVFANFVLGQIIGLVDEVKSDRPFEVLVSDRLGVIFHEAGMDVVVLKIASPDNDDPVV